jgi:hypothetical protein
MANRLAFLADHKPLGKSVTLGLPRLIGPD